MRLYFVRHGESILNAQNVHQYPDVALSKTGLNQAKLVAKRFKNIPVKIIISSDFARARQTAEEIARVTEKEIVFTPLLRERQRPTILHGKSYDAEKTVELLKLLYDNRHNKNWRHSDEENFHDVIERAKKLLDFVEKRKEDQIAVVSHAAFIKFIMTYMLFGDEANADHFHHIFDFFKSDNTGISICEKQTNFYNKVKKQWRLLTWNDHAHLGES